MSEYRRVDAPRGAEFQAHDCHRCGHPDLEQPVWLASPTGSPTPFGTDCAAILLGIPRLELEAELAAVDLEELLAREPRAAAGWELFVLCLPSRVSRAFLADVRDRMGATVGPTVLRDLERIYRALRRSEKVRTWRDLLPSSSATVKR